MHHLPNSSGPLGRSLTLSHVRPATANTVVSQSQVPPVVSAGHVPISGSSHVPAHGVPHIPNYGPSHGTSHGTPYGSSHGPSHGTAYGSSHGNSYGLQYGQNYQPYGYGYQQLAYSSNYGFVAPHNQGTPHHNASMQPFMGHMGGCYYPTGQGHGVYSNHHYMNHSYQGAWH